MKTFGIGSRGGRHVDLWCTGTRDKFEVINGGWSGALQPDGSLKASAGVVEGPLDVLWEGEVPPPANGHYNSAIAWINTELAARGTAVLEDVGGVHLDQSGNENGLLDLLPCPFCGVRGTMLIEELGRTWLGTRYSEAVSVEVRHWCPPVAGQPRARLIARVGRDKQSAIAAWNTRCYGP